MDNSRENILKKIDTVKPFKKLLDTDIKVYKETKGSLIDIFKTELENVDGEVVVCNDKKELVDLLHSYLKDNKINNIYTFLPEFIEDLTDNGYNASKKFTDKIELSITACEYLSARTGTVIVSSKVTGRRINIFAPIHIVIARKSQLVKDIDEGLDKLTEKYKYLPSAISYITGPSRTADIEKTLIIGAHGPKKLIVFIENN